jgi:hypothetical protein
MTEENPSGIVWIKTQQELLEIVNELEDIMGRVNVIAQDIFTEMNPHPFR